MTKAIAIALLGIALFSNRAAAQSIVEQEQIVRDFQQRVADYAQRPMCLGHPDALKAGAPAPTLFTLPVAVIFRHRIADALSASRGPVIRSIAPGHRAIPMQPLPGSELSPFPQALRAALPALPAPLEYRLIDNDLVIRDAEADLVIAVLRHALDTIPTR